MKKFEPKPDLNIKIEEISELKSKIMREAVVSSDPKILEKLLNKIAVFRDRLKEKYRDYETFRTWHILAGSSIRTESEKFDFPDEDSVEKFFLEL